jgi:hypothetical protein
MRDRKPVSKEKIYNRNSGVTIYYYFVAPKTTKNAFKKITCLIISRAFCVLECLLMTLTHKPITRCQMNNLFFRKLKAMLLLCVTGTVFFISASQAQTIIKPEPATATTYSVKPDYRKCAFPMCGGWFLTPLNQYSLQLESEDEAYQTSALLPNSIYVAYINYRPLGLKPAQIKELEDAMNSGQALLRGTITTSPIVTSTFVAKTLFVNGAWTGANKTVALGPYLKVSSSGIVCITTPCPYYNANLINSLSSFNFHELTFAKAELTREQEMQAWQAVATDGLVMTGLRYVSQGQVGTGVGISATKVFFAFPAKP